MISTVVAVVSLVAVAIMEAWLNVKLYRNSKEWKNDMEEQWHRQKEALRALYEHAQKTCEIRKDMLRKIADLERCAQAHEVRITEQEGKQWKD